MSKRKDREEQPPSYALRLTERAQRDVDAATVHLIETTSPGAAVTWREGLYEALATLATFPHSHPSVPEQFRREVRQILYRRPGSRTAYRIQFTVVGEAVTAPDGPTVIILHVRHASARPITRTEIRAIERES